MIIIRQNTRHWNKFNCFLRAHLHILDSLCKSRNHCLFENKFYGTKTIFCSLFKKFYLRLLMLVFIITFTCTLFNVFLYLFCDSAIVELFLCLLQTIQYYWSWHRRFLVWQRFWVCSSSRHPENLYSVESAGTESSYHWTSNSRGVQLPHQMSTYQVFPCSVLWFYGILHLRWLTFLHQDPRKCSIFSCTLQQHLKYKDWKLKHCYLWSII